MGKLKLLLHGAIAAGLLVLLAWPAFGEEVFSELLKMFGPIGLFIELIRILGIPGLIIVIWYFDRRDTHKTLEQYGQHMREQRKMYESNVSLVKDYQRVAEDLKEVVIMNTQAITRLDERLKGRGKG